MILLVNPPHKTDYVRVERCMQPRDAWSSLWQPIQLCYIQAVLEEKGHKTRLIDCIAESMDFKVLEDEIRKDNPNFVVINIAIPTLENDLRVAEISKRVCKSKTVAVGMPAKIVPELLMANKNLDAIISGEAEAAIFDFIKGKKGLLKKDVAFKKLPFPCFRDIPIDAYKMPFTGERMALVVPSRGCTFECSFCLVPIYYGRKVKFRDSEHIVNELERDIKEHKIRTFLFWSETFTINKKFVIQICDEIVKRDLRMKWMAPSRADTIDREMLESMKSAGCFMLSFGIESMKQEVLDKVNKKIKVSQIEQAIKLCNDTGIDVMAHIIVGLPGQTKESVKETVNELIQFNISYLQVYCAVPYPKTGLHKIANESGWIINKDMRFYEIDKAVMRNEIMSSEEIQNLRRWCLGRFYLRPLFIIKQFLKTPSYRLILDGLRFFLRWVKN